MAAQAPFVQQQSLNTHLGPLEEFAFRQWLNDNRVPFDPEAGVTDYDMRGYYRGLKNGHPMAVPTKMNQNDGRPHYTDYYKTPLHQSFSAASQWAGPNSPDWINDHQLVAPNGRVMFDEKRPSSPMEQILGLIGGHDDLPLILRGR